MQSKQYLSCVKKRLKKIGDIIFAKYLVINFIITIFAEAKHLEEIILPGEHRIKLAF